MGAQKPVIGVHILCMHVSLRPTSNNLPGKKERKGRKKESNLRTSATQHMCVAPALPGAGPAATHRQGVGNTSRTRRAGRLEWGWVGLSQSPLRYAGPSLASVAPPPHQAPKGGLTGRIELGWVESLHAVLPRATPCRCSRPASTRGALWVLPDGHARRKEAGPARSCPVGVAAGGARGCVSTCPALAAPPPRPCGVPGPVRARPAGAGRAG